MKRSYHAPVITLDPMEESLLTDSNPDQIQIYNKTVSDDPNNAFTKSTIPTIDTNL